MFLKKSPCKPQISDLCDELWLLQFNGFRLLLTMETVFKKYYFLDFCDFKATEAVMIFFSDIPYSTGIKIYVLQTEIRTQMTDTVLTNNGRWAMLQISV